MFVLYTSTMLNKWLLLCLLFHLHLTFLVFQQLALYVLSFLEPKDLLQAAQTCRYWRILAEDNLLWREKCREEGEHQMQIRRRLQCAEPAFKISCLLKTKPASHICLSLSHNRHRWASAPQEEENCQTWLHPQPVEMCLHQAAQNRHQLEERGPQIPKGSFFLRLHIELEDGMFSLLLKSLDLCFPSLKVWAMHDQHTTAGGLHFADSLGTF